ncbi:MAG: hypothetical protein Q9M50_04675 [Methylococcales bacterium]|nr:hypothetical protein [Methylococcales bacterium]
MIYRILSMTAKPGKVIEARQLLLDVAAHVMENYTHKAEVLSNCSGASNQLHFIGYHESLSTLDKVFKKFETDSKGKELMAKFPDVFENDRVIRLYRLES